MFVTRYRFVYLLSSQLLLVFLYPALDGVVTEDFLLEVIIALALMGGIFPTVTERRQLLVALTLGVVFLAPRWWGFWSNAPAFIVLSYAAGAAFYAFIAGVIVQRLFVDITQINADLIIGSVCVYLLLGAVFGFIYVVLHLIAPGSFAGLIPMTDDPRDLGQRFIYYSFVTLTTLGYGDIVPVTHLAGVLAYLEAVLGQVYLVVMVARLVGMHVAQQSRRR